MTTESQNPSPNHPTWVITIAETIHYYEYVQAATADEAEELLQERMESPDWEDPRYSDVQGSAIISVELESVEPK